MRRVADTCMPAFSASFAKSLPYISKNIWEAASKNMEHTLGLHIDVLRHTIPRFKGFSVHTPCLELNESIDDSPEFLRTRLELSEHPIFDVPGEGGDRNGEQNNNDSGEKTANSETSIKHL